MVKSQSGANIFDGAINGILEIETESGQGSGFLLDDKGYALTNAHVVTDDGVPNKEILVRIAGEEITAKIVKIGDVSADIDDLALIKLSRVPKNSISLVLGNYDDVKTGEEIFVIGNSKGEGTCITKGIVSDRNRKGRIMTDAAVNPGNSGGPVFNQRGFVVGIIVSVRINADGMKYAIPVDVIRSFLIEQCNYSITQNTKNNFINANYEDDNQQNCTEKNKNNSIATNKCPNCGGRFNIKLLDAQIVCPYCGYTELLNSSGANIDIVKLRELESKNEREKLERELAEKEKAKKTKNKKIFFISLSICVVILAVLSFITADNVGFSPFQLILIPLVIVGIVLGTKEIKSNFKK